MDTGSKNSWFLGRPCKEEATFLNKLWAYKKSVDQLVIVKLHFFSYIAGLLEPFKRLYQTDYSIIPFLFLDIKVILRTLLAIVVKPDVLKDIHMGFGAESEIQKQLRTDSCSGKDVENVRRGSKVYFCISFENNRKIY